MAGKWQLKLAKKQTAKVKAIRHFMIYDCFTLFNELELLELRLNELGEVVDKFILVEATRTHSNQPKPLYYQENRSRFSAFHDKIIHVIADDLPNAKNAWVLENYQRNCIARGLVNCRPDDWILVSDLDEIPRASVVKKSSGQIPFYDTFFSNAVHGALSSRLTQKIFFRKGLRRLLRKNHPFVWRFEHTLYRYFMNTRSLREPRCYGTVMLRYRDFTCANELRHSGYKTIPDAGWHFTYIGGVDRVREKIAAYAHQEFNHAQFTAPEVVAERIRQGDWLFGGSENLQLLPLDNSFPNYLRQHPENFSHLLKSSWI